MDPSKSLWRSLDTVTASSTNLFAAADVRAPGLTILAHGDPRRIGECVGLPALISGREVELSRLSPAFRPPTEQGTWRPLAEPHLSRHPLRLVPHDDGRMELHTAGSRTRLEVDGVEVMGHRTITPDELEHGLVLLLADRVALLLHYLDPSPPGNVPRFGLVGESPGMVQVRQQIARVAELDVPVLVRGETGTGKEVVANSIHQGSRRRSGPLVAVNMGALPAALAAAELFGATKGAFTGADRKRAGFFSRARQGSLFLDEIGEAPFEVQGMLLRTLETGEVQPVGSDTAHRVDVRIIAATDAALETAIEDGRFRAPLLHRLSGYDLWLPPLRQRREDIGRLLIHFLRQELETLGETWRLEDHTGKHSWLPAPLVAQLSRYDWPGNVRQLRNMARQLMISHRGARRLAMTPRIERLLSDSPTVGDVPLSPPPGPAIAHQETPSTSGGLVYDRPVLRALVAVGWLDADTDADTELRRDRLARRLLGPHDGYEMDHSEGFLLLFARPVDAVAYASAFHAAVSDLSQRLGSTLEARLGIHFGEVTLRRNGPSDVERGARPFELEGGARIVVRQVMRLARCGQSLITRTALELARQTASNEPSAALGAMDSQSHGLFNLAAAPDGIEILAIGPHSDVRPSSGTAASGETASAPDSPEPSPAESKPVYRAPDTLDEDELLAALRAHAFRLQPTAAALGISRTSLYALIAKSPRIRKAKDLSADDIERCRARCDNDLDRMAAELEVSRKGLRRRMTLLGLP